MNKLNRLLFSICFSILISLSGCAVTPTDDIKIDAEADPKVKFGGYKTYAWLGSAGILKDPEGKWKQPDFDVDAEIRFLIDRELRKRGFTETGNKPDMLIAYAMGVNMAALKVKENPETKEKLLKNTPKGSLLIILADPTTEYVMWIGRAKAEVLKDPAVEVTKARLDYAVTQMLKKIPK